MEKLDNVLKITNFINLTKTLLYMKNFLLKNLLLVVMGLFLYTGTAKADFPIEKPSDNVSEQATSQTSQGQVSKQNVLKEQIKTLTFKEKIKFLRKIRKETKIDKKSSVKAVPKVVLYILAIIIPPVAVGLHTDWGEPTLWNLLWTLLFGIPGIIHAFYIILK